MPLAQRGQQSQKFGRSKGGFSTKVHVTTDSLGCPTRFILTGGNESDYTQAVHLIEDQQADFVIADKGYDSQAIVDAIKSKGAEPVIPARSLRKTPREYDRYIYKERNAIERMFNKIKHFRRISTRYDKLAIAYLSFLHVAAIAVWLR
jgi:transposase